MRNFSDSKFGPEFFFLIYTHSMHNSLDRLSQKKISCIFPLQNFLDTIPLHAILSLNTYEKYIFIVHVKPQKIHKHLYFYALLNYKPFRIWTGNSFFFWIRKNSFNLSINLNPELLFLFLLLFFNNFYEQILSSQCQLGKEREKRKRRDALDRGKGVWSILFVEDSDV